MRYRKSQFPEDVMPFSVCFVGMRTGRIEQVHQAVSQIGEVLLNGIPVDVFYYTDLVGYPACFFKNRFRWIDVVEDGEQQSGIEVPVVKGNSPAIIDKRFYRWVIGAVADVERSDRKSHFTQYACGQSTSRPDVEDMCAFRQF